MQNEYSPASLPGLAPRLFRHVCAGAAIGYAVLHPASVIIYDKLGPGSIALQSSIISAFDLDHQWMAVYFAAIGCVFGLLHGFNHHRMTILLERIRRLSITDALTGLYNRRFLAECLNREWQRAKRYDSALSLVMIDVDHFKNYNDVNGHQSGDRLLHVLANQIGRIARQTDVVARYGGEEFVILMPNTPISMAIHLAERIRRDIASYPFENRETQPDGKITISVGCAQRNEGATEGADQLIKMADDCLYRAKSCGRNQIWYEGCAANRRGRRPSVNRWKKCAGHAQNQRCDVEATTP